MPESHHSKTPQFAVVGHPNKGKSSIVATLSHNDNIAISAISGTTTQATPYPFVINGETQYILIDTPGFQRPRQTLEAIKKLASDASERPRAIDRFIAECTQDSADSPSHIFKDEIELLKPIMHGAGIIYVVDGSVPYTPEYEAEMTILQWTGQPRMALINPIGNTQFIDEWQNALGQFFSLVKVFNPMYGGVEKQLEVLEAFAQINEEWRTPLKRAITSLEQHDQQIHNQAAYIITEYMIKCMSYEKSLPLPSEALQEQLKATLKKQYQSTLKNLEQEFNTQIKELYTQYRLEDKTLDVDIDFPELFNQDYWYLFGLTRQKLILLATSAGAAAGGLLDIAVGGASFMTGAITGGVIGGTASLFLSAQPDKIHVKGVPLGGKKIVMGPVKNLQFAYVILGRALTYQQAIASRTHADQSQLSLNSDNSPILQQKLQQLSTQTQVQLTQLLQKSAKGLSNSDIEKLRDIVSQILVST